MQGAFAIGGYTVLVLAASLVGGLSPAQAQSAAQCQQFSALNQETQAKANAVNTAMKAKADRKQICDALKTFVAAEGKVVNFLVVNQTWCGVPPTVVVNAKASHEKSIKFRDAACAEAPHPKIPTLSDAIKTEPVDSATNTKAGAYGTFDSLTGNPLSR